MRVWSGAIVAVLCLQVPGWASQETNGRAAKAGRATKHKKARPGKTNTRWLDNCLKRLQQGEQRTKRYARLQDPKALEALKQLKATYETAMKALTERIEQAKQGKARAFWPEYGSVMRRTGGLERLLGLYGQRAYAEHMQKRPADPSQGEAAKEAIGLCDELIAVEEQMAKLAEQQQDLTKRLQDLRRKLYRKHASRKKSQPPPEIEF